MAPARSVTRLALGCVRRFATPDIFQTMRHAGWRAAAAAESLCSIQISGLLSWRKSFWLQSMPAQPTGLADIDQIHMKLDGGGGTTNWCSAVVGEKSRFHSQHTLRPPDRSWRN